MISISYSLVLILIGVLLLLTAIIYTLSSKEEVVIVGNGQAINQTGDTKQVKAKLIFNCEQKPLTEKEHKILADIVLNFEQVINGNYQFPKELHPHYDAIKDEISTNKNTKPSITNEISDNDKDFEELT